MAMPLAADHHYPPERVLAKRSPTAIDVHVGTRVRQARLASSMSQGELGDAMGLTFQQVQKYETGASRIGASRMVQIATALNRPVAWFFAEVPGCDGASATEIDAIQQLGASREGLKLARAFLEIKNPKMRSAIVAMICTAAGQDEP